MTRKHRTKKKTMENLKEELRELKEDYKEARREIKDIKKDVQILSESREYWKEKIRRRDANVELTTAQEDLILDERRRRYEDEDN